MGLEGPGMECAKSSCMTMTSLGLLAACPSHLTLCRLIWSAMLAWPERASSSAVEGPPGPRWRPIICLRQPLWKVSSCECTLLSTYPIHHHCQNGVQETTPCHVCQHYALIGRPLTQESMPPINDKQGLKLSGYQRTPRKIQTLKLKLHTTNTRMT